jgi:hypothetical protein
MKAKVARLVASGWTGRPIYADDRGCLAPELADEMDEELLEAGAGCKVSRTRPVLDGLAFVDLEQESGS